MLSGETNRHCPERTDTVCVRSNDAVAVPFDYCEVGDKDLWMTGIVFSRRFNTEASLLRAVDLCLSLKGGVLLGVYWNPGAFSGEAGCV